MALGGNPGSYEVRLSPAVARRLAAPDSRLLTDHFGYLLPGRIRHLGDGWLRLDPMAVLSLRGRLVDPRIEDDAGDGQVLVIGRDSYPLRPVERPNRRCW